MEGRFGSLIEQSVGDWWILPGQRAQGLELTLLTPDQERHELTLYHRAIRIGTDRACQLRLQAPELLQHHCEVVVEDQGLWCRLLDPRAAVSVNGQPLDFKKPVHVGTGDTLEVGPFSVTIGMQRVRKLDNRVEFEVTQALYFQSRDPIDVLGVDAPWVRVSAGNWHGYLKLPSGWLRSAYDQLGWVPPSQKSQPLGPFTIDDEVDRSLSSFVMRRIADSFAQRSALDVEVSGVASGAVIADGIPLDAPHVGARFRLRLADRLFESELFWSAELHERLIEDSPRGPIGSCLDAKELSFDVSIVAGSVSLPPTDLQFLSPGDILLPDDWLPRGLVGENETCQVELLIQDWYRSATIEMSGDAVGQATNLSLSSATWTLSDGGNMTHENTLDPTEGMAEERRSDADATPGEPSVGSLEAIDLERELEVVVAFELDRVSVPLAELAHWEEGATISLNRRPNDDVKILLRQGKGSRLLGYGRAIVVDEKLGIQIQKWLGAPGGGT
jgi:flagellar motor switch/type III secretory pathway protein FliN